MWVSFQCFRNWYFYTMLAMLKIWTRNITVSSKISHFYLKTSNNFITCTCNCHSVHPRARNCLWLLYHANCLKLVLCNLRQSILLTDLFPYVCFTTLTIPVFDLWWICCEMCIYINSLIYRTVQHEITVAFWFGEWEFLDTLSLGPRIFLFNECFWFMQFLL
jgi:hypothetical protein